jgi:hypothetical protein
MSQKLIINIQKLQIVTIDIKYLLGFVSPIQSIVIQRIHIINYVCSKSIMLSDLLSIVSILLEIKTPKNLSSSVWIRINSIFDN